ncbi:hypothetical protein BH23BAC1_BH23BAC1_23890 [soil metagenome]
MVGSGYCLSSCSSTESIDEEKGIVYFKNVKYLELPVENRKMVYIYQDTFLQAIPDRFYYLNSLRAQEYADIEKSVIGAQRIQFLYNYASELLYSGKMEESRAKLYELLNIMQFEEDDIQKENAPIHTLIGLSYIYQALLEDNKSNYTTFFQIKNEYNIKDSSLDLLRPAKLTFGNLGQKFPEDNYYSWINKLLDSWLEGYFILKETNQQFQNSNNLYFKESATLKGIHHKGMIGGICVADFNKDGYYDLFSGSIGLNDALFYYEGNSNGNFKLRSKEAFLEGSIGGGSIIQGDFDNDGFPDVYIIRGATLSFTGRQPNSLLKNNGDGTFTDITEQAGLLDFYPGNHAHFVDYNNDGFLDIFVANESLTSYFRNANPCQLFHNNGDGTFTEVGKNYGLDISQMVKGSSWLDVNNDGLLDLYISIEGDSNRLYLNKGFQASNNKWLFEPIAKAAGASLPLRSGYSVANDFNQDGWEDLLVYGTNPNDMTAFYLNPFMENLNSTFEPILFLNQGDGSFQQANKLWMVDYDLMVLGGASGDIDNNGYPDIYTGTGNSHIQTIIPNSLIRNSGKTLLVDKTSSGISFLNKTHTVQLVDINFDGQLDIVATMGGFFEFERWNPALMINESNLTNSWIQIELEGKSANKQGIGSLIEVTTRSLDGKEKKGFYRISTNQSPSVAHIGLGKADEIAKITIYWPDANGNIQTVKDVEINQFIRINQE